MTTEASKILDRLKDKTEAASPNKIQDHPLVKLLMSQALEDEMDDDEMDSLITLLDDGIGGDNDDEIITKLNSLIRQFKLDKIELIK